jgi:hypothetical protein
MSKIKILLTIFLLVWCKHPESKEYERHKRESTYDLLRDEDEGAPNRYKVIRINNAGTFVLLVDGKEQVVRFAHIDCPEKNNHLETKQNNLFPNYVLGNM